MKKILALLLALTMTLSIFCVMAVPSANANTLWGIDVSKWQGSIDWDKVKAAGVDFAILRGWCNGKDTYFETNYAGAKAAGVPIGVYCFTYGDTVAEITAEMNNLLTVLNGKQFEYPIYVDMEDASVYGSYSKSYNANLAITALNILENAGYYAGIYTYTSFVQSYLDMTNIANRYTTWIADYRTTCGYTGPYDMWQYSCTGSVNGISGDVDMNYCYKTDFESIIKTVGLNGYEPSVSYPYENDNGSLVLYDGEYTHSISTDFSTNASTTTNNKTEGSKSLKMTCTDPDANTIGGMVHHKLTTSANLTNYNYISFDLYLSTATTGSHGFQVNFTTSGQDGFNAMQALNDKQAGWYTFTLEKSKIGKAVDTADWSNINNMRLTWFNYAGVSTETYFLIDNIRAHVNKSDVEGTPTVAYPYTIDNDNMMLYDGEDLTPTSSAFQTTLSQDTANKTQGTSALKMTYGNPLGQTGDGGNDVGGMAYVSLTSTADVSDYDVLSYDLYIPQDIDSSNGFQLNLCSEKSDGFNFMKPLKGLKNGWNHIEMDLAGATVAPGVAYADKSDINSMRFTWFNYDAIEIPYLIIDNVKVTKLPDVPVVDEAVEAVISAIDALPAAGSVTRDHADAINAAKSAYDNLTETQKGNVTNSQKLADCVAALNNLPPLVDEAVQNTIAAIEKLPEVKDVAESDRADVEKAKAMYDALTNDQKSQVTNSQRLTDLLAALDNTTKIKYGDINKSGVVDAADALMALQFAVEKISLTDEQFTIGDVDGSKALNATDALLILKYAVGKISYFPVEK